MRTIVMGTSATGRVAPRSRDSGSIEVCLDVSCHDAGSASPTADREPLNLGEPSEAAR